MSTRGSMHKGTYRTWCDMRYRCFNERAQQFKNYGARGITVCERWLSYQNFVDDMGERPDGLTLERKNNDGNYEPDNCAWATRYEQRINQRTIHWISYDGYSKPLRHWAAQFGMSEHTLYHRLFRRGMSISDALNKPVDPKFRNGNSNKRSALNPKPEAASHE